MSAPPLPLAVRRFGGSLGRRYSLFLAGFVLLIVTMAVAERLGLPRGWIGASFLVVTVGVYALSLIHI